MQTEKGEIVQIGDGKVIVQMEAGSQCQYCGAKHVCSAMSDVMRQIEIPAKGDVQIGYHVAISYQSQSRIFSAIIVFILPVLFLIAGYFIGVKLFGTEGKAILTALGGLVIAFILNWGLNKIFEKDRHFIPTIVNIDK